MTEVFANRGSSWTPILSMNGQHHWFDKSLSFSAAELGCRLLSISSFIGGFQFPYVYRHNMWSLVTDFTHIINIPYVYTYSLCHENTIWRSSRFWLQRVSSVVPLPGLPRTSALVPTSRTERDLLFWCSCVPGPPKYPK